MRLNAQQPNLHVLVSLLSALSPTPSTLIAAAHTECICSGPTTGSLAPGLSNKRIDRGKRNLSLVVRPHPRVHRPTRLCSASCPPPGLPAPRCRRRRGRISSRRASAVAEEANAGPGGPMNWLTIIAAYAVRCSDLVRWLQVVVFARRGTVFRPRLAFCLRCRCSSRVPGSDRPCCA